ncbi:MAG: 6-bladed beta-propeller, partial [Syntrophomonadaceae bacterium]
MGTGGQLNSEYTVRGGPVLKFSYDGKFLGEILKIGRGPEEIDGGAEVSILPDKRLIVSHKLSQRKLYYFSYDGKFIKSVNSPLRGSVHVLKDGKNLYYQKGSPGGSKYSFILTNEKNDTISFVKNYKSWINTGQLAISSGISYSKSLYYVGSKIFFKNVYNDTVYSISSNKIVPSF